MNRSTCNVCMLTLAYTCVTTCGGTIMNALETLTDAIRSDDAAYDGDAYVALGAFFGSAALFVCAAPAIVRCLGVRVAMAVSTTAHVAFALHLLRPIGWLLYALSALDGASAAVNMAALVDYLARSSTYDTIERNGALFWFVSQFGRVLGNAYAIALTSTNANANANTLDAPARVCLFAGLGGVGVFAVLLFACLREPIYRWATLPPNVGTCVFAACLRSAWLIVERDMLLFVVWFAYVGVSTAFYTGVYSNVISMTPVFYKQYNRQVLVSTSGLLMAVGEMTAAAVVIRFARYTAKTRTVIVCVGCALHVACYACVLLTFPGDESDSPAFLPSNLGLALTCSLLMGAGHACCMTQVFRTLDSIFQQDGAPAFALFRFAQLSSAAVAFPCVRIAPLRVIVGVLLASCLVGTTTFCVAALRPTYVPPPPHRRNSTGPVAVAAAISKSFIVTKIKSLLEYPNIPKEHSKIDWSSESLFDA